MLPKYIQKIVLKSFYKKVKPQAGEIYSAHICTKELVVERGGGAQWLRHNAVAIGKQVSGQRSGGNIPIRNPNADKAHENHSLGENLVLLGQRESSEGDLSKLLPH